MLATTSTLPVACAPTTFVDRCINGSVAKMAHVPTTVATARIPVCFPAHMASHKLTPKLHCCCTSAIVAPLDTLYHQALVAPPANANIKVALTVAIRTARSTDGWTFHLWTFWPLDTDTMMIAPTQQPRDIRTAAKPHPGVFVRSVRAQMLPLVLGWGLATRERFSAIAVINGSFLGTPGAESVVVLEFAPSSITLLFGADMLDMT